MYPAQQDPQGWSWLRAADQSLSSQGASLPTFLFLLGSTDGKARLSMLSLLLSGALLDVPLLSHSHCPQSSFWVPLVVLVHISLLLL